MTKPKPREGEIWAVAGGKGGTGKTFLVSSLGTHLARNQNRVILVDFDLGGANLHSFFGLSGPRPSLTSFFETGSSLDALTVPTQIDNLSLITGNIDSITSSSVRFSQKLKLFRQMMKLRAEYVLVDLGAGCHVNTLDTFLMADKMIAILVPEITAVENMFLFIKNALFRKLQAILKRHGRKDLLGPLWEERDRHNIRNIRDLIDYLGTSVPEVGAFLAEELGRFRLSIVVNMTRDNQDIGLGLSLKSLLAKYLGLEARYSGYIGYDDAVWRSVRERRPFMLFYPASASAKQIESLAANLIGNEEIRVI